MQNISILISEEIYHTIIAYAPQKSTKTTNIGGLIWSIKIENLVTLFPVCHLEKYPVSALGLTPKFCVTISKSDLK